MTAKLYRRENGDGTETLISMRIGDIKECHDLPYPKKKTSKDDSGRSHDVEERLKSASAAQSSRSPRNQA